MTAWVPWVFRQVGCKLWNASMRAAAAGPKTPPPPSFELQPQHPPPTTTTRLPFASQPAPRRCRWTFTSGRRHLFLSTACGSALPPTRSSRVADENVPQEPALARTKTLPRRGIVIPAQRAANPAASRPRSRRARTDPRWKEPRQRSRHALRLHPSPSPASSMTRLSSTTYQPSAIYPERRGPPSATCQTSFST